jgi:uncharacterized protein YkwD
MNPVARPSRRGPNRALVAIAALLATVVVGTGSAHAATGGADLTQDVAPATVGSHQQVLPDGWRADMLARVNSVRAGAGLVPLRSCDSLRRTAQDYALVMAQNRTFGHVGPDGTAPWDRMRANGFDWRAAAENIATGQGSIDEVMRRWLESPSHYANVMDPRMRQVGFGFAVVPGTGGETYWVQDFGRGRGC